MKQHLSSQQLLDYVYQALTDIQRETMDFHLTRCPECRARLAEQEVIERRLRQCVKAVRRQMPLPSPVDFAAIAPRLKRKRRLTMFVKRSNQVLYGAATLVILIMLAIGLVTVFRGVNPSVTTGPEAQIQPPADNPDSIEEPPTTAIEPAIPPQHEAEMAVISGYMDVDGINLYYEMIGSGPPLVLLHDAILHREVWDGQFEALANEGYSVIRYDRRGYGLSENDGAGYSNLNDLRRLLIFLEKNRVTLIGSSYGGQMALDFTLAYPDMVDALVVVGAPLSGSSFSKNDLLSAAWRDIVFKRYFWRIVAHLYPDRDPVTFYVRDPEEAKQAIEWWLDDPLAYDWILPENFEVRQQVRDLLLANPQNITHHRYITGPEQPANGRLAGIQVPTLIIVGESDNPAVHEHADKIEAGITGAEKVVIPKAGHLVHLEQAELFNQTVLDFLQQ